MAPITAQRDCAEAKSAKGATKSVQTAPKQPENTPWETEDEPWEAAEPELPGSLTATRKENTDALPSTTRKTTPKGPIVQETIIVEKPPTNEQVPNNTAFGRSSKMSWTPPQVITEPQGPPPGAPKKPKTRQADQSTSIRPSNSNDIIQAKHDSHDTVLSLLGDILIAISTLKVNPTEDESKKGLLSLIGKAVKKADDENQRVEQARNAAIEQSISEIKAMIAPNPPELPTNMRTNPPELPTNMSRACAQVASTPVPPPHLVEAAKHERQRKLKEQHEKTEVALSFRESPTNNTRAEEVKALSEAAIADCLQKSINEPSLSNSALCTIENLSVKKVSKWCIKVICSTSEDAAMLRTAIDWEMMMGAKLATTVYGVVVYGVAKSNVNPTTNESDSIAKSIQDLETLNAIKVTH
jgi:hypothetical protein